ncbi:Transcriptional regulator, MerR family [Rhodococcus sp. AW25M09]|nr:Transcriptional regulator, MerR family [Rhodococcus sp. AW25M09]
MSTRSLRYYEEQSLIESIRDANGYRCYPESAELTVYRIRGLLRAGFGTESIREILPCVSGPALHIDMCPQVVAQMQRTLDAVEVEREALRHKSESIRTLLES